MAGSIKGKIVAISPEGNAVSDISIERLQTVPSDDSVNVSCDGHVTHKIFPVTHEQPSMTFIAFRGGTGFLELALVGDSVSKFLGIQTGADITVSW